MIAVLHAIADVSAITRMSHPRPDRCYDRITAMVNKRKVRELAMQVLFLWGRAGEP